MTGPERAVVLIVDDEPAVADSYAAHVRDTHDVRTAYGGEQALSKLDDDVDVVLLDRRMPDLVGDEVLETVRERGVDCRVAMVTAVDADFDIVDMEFDDYVVKPVTGEELLDTVDRLLRCAQYERRLREYYRVTRTYVALRSTKDAAELADSDEFRRLEDRRAELRASLSTAAESLADDDFEALFRDLEQ
ncbi:response regulator [Halosimplex rubrum]|uniref:Response regulator n=1 Tax=Halosimplex rubrum TaxID=869889 RepID=A0A7D5PCK4_9EURY|nr:response regulator [Halosimplex rubrum]QLH79379.1 response regulator [Halosimplex rubrum]